MNLNRFLGISLVLASLTSCGRQGENKEPPTVPGDGEARASTDPEIRAGKGVASTRQVYFLDWTWLVAPAAETTLSAQFTLTLPSGASPASVTGLKVEPWMPSMGHGTYTRDQVIKRVSDSAQTYQIDGMYLTMGGAWDVRVYATVDGQADVATVTVEVP